MAQRRTRFPLPTRPFSRTRGARPSPATSQPRGLDGGTAGGCGRPGRSPVVDAAIYRDGVQIASPGTVAEVTRQRRRTRVLRLDRDAAADQAQLLPVADEFGFHEIAVEDAIVAHQRPKLERYGDTLFVVLRAAIPGQGGGGRVRRDPHLRRTELRAHGAPQPDARPGSRPGTDGKRPGAARTRSGGGPLRDPRQRRRRLRPGRRGPPKDIDEIEVQVFRNDPKVSRRIYELSGEVIEFQRSTRPLMGMLDGLRPGSTSTAPTTSSSATCATSPTTRRPSWSAWTTSARCCPTC